MRRAVWFALALCMAAFALGFAVGGEELCRRLPEYGSDWQAREAELVRREGRGAVLLRKHLARGGDVSGAISCMKATSVPGDRVTLVEVPQDHGHLVYLVWWDGGAWRADPVKRESFYHGFEPLRAVRSPGGLDLLNPSHVLTPLQDR